MDVVLIILFFSGFLEDKKGQGAGKFAFASYYNDHMVLQRAPFQAVVWGFYPDVGTRIILKVYSLNSKIYLTYKAEILWFE